MSGNQHCWIPWHAYDREHLISNLDIETIFDRIQIEYLGIEARKILILQKP